MFSPSLNSLLQEHLRTVSTAAASGGEPDGRSTLLVPGSAVDAGQQQQTTPTHPFHHPLHLHHTQQLDPFLSRFEDQRSTVSKRTAVKMQLAQWRKELDRKLAEWDLETRQYHHEDEKESYHQHEHEVMEEGVA